MEWTREQRYRKLEHANKWEIDELLEKVNSCSWRQNFHIQPKTGLLNDPNGFAFYNGEYHLFYQWFPLGPVHGLKYWYHIKSTNLVEWNDVGVGIAPDTKYESHGAFSGTGMVHNQHLYLFYTGNTRDSEWKRHPFQLMAIMNQEGQITKVEKPIVENVPSGYTDHFRDPKVWKEDNVFYMIIGAQRLDQSGCIVLYKSYDLIEWKFVREIETNMQDFGYMWECPDYFILEEKGVFIFSPQGLSPSDDHYQNIYQAGYVIGNKLDLENVRMEHSVFTELDRGFDFYAPQTIEDEKGRRILIGWMGLPDIAYPTDVNGWAHCLTLPRELSIENGKLLQKPIKELELLRKEEMTVEDFLKNEYKNYTGFSGTSYELIAEFNDIKASHIGMEFRVSKTEKTVIQYDVLHKKLMLDRGQSGEDVAVEYGTTRKCSLGATKLKLHLFVDVSSVEIFVNDGEEVFTSRIFPKEESQDIVFFSKNGSVSLKSTMWQYV